MKNILKEITISPIAIREIGDFNLQPHSISTRALSSPLPTIAGLMNVKTNNEVKYGLPVKNEIISTRKL